MAMSAQELADLEEQLHAMLVGKGWSIGDADEIIETASNAAHQGIASMVAIAGAAKEHNRDSAIVLAIHIMERLALSSESRLELGELPGKSGEEGN